jgi:hypothetical protein
MMQPDARAAVRGAISYHPQEQFRSNAIIGNRSNAFIGRPGPYSQAVSEAAFFGRPVPSSIHTVSTQAGRFSQSLGTSQTIGTSQTYPASVATASGNQSDSGAPKA